MNVKAARQRQAVVPAASPRQPHETAPTLGPSNCALAWWAAASVRNRRRVCVSTVGCDGDLPDRRRADQIAASVVVAEVTGRSRRGCPNQGSYSLTPAKMLTVFSLVARREARVPRAGAPAPGRPFIFSLAPGGRTSSINHVKWEMSDWSFDGWLSTPQLCSSRRLRDQLRP
jgi:hypothetical protein